MAGALGGLFVLVFDKGFDVLHDKPVTVVIGTSTSTPAPTQGQVAGQPKPQPQPQPPSGPQFGQLCSPVGAIGFTVDGRPAKCFSGMDGKARWGYRS